MKTWALILCSVGQTLMAEWIEPPRQSSQGHLVPRPDYQPDFPRDLGAHRDYGLEWWYWVGHLKEVDGEREFG
ncbi:MAG: carotenoid 1,2-hydratase, partial [Verrucomicrobiota bacterium]|nr:carotenoid 1,2-hydratase [Verrucomicrobiota bacterium]